MGRPSNTELRQAQIVDALLSVMVREGYEHATVIAIAKEAGLAPGLLHYHFGNKRDILVALVERLATGLRTRIASRLAAAGTTPRARLHALIDAHVALGTDADPRAVAAWVVIGSEAVRQADVRTLYTLAIRQSFEELRQLVLQVLTDEGRDTDDVMFITAAVMSAIQGAYLLSAAAPDSLPQGYAAPMLSLMIDGLLERAPRH